LVIPFSLLLLLGTANEMLITHHDPWYLESIGLVIGLIGIPLAVGLLRKRRFSLVLVYVMFALALLQVVVQLPIAIAHFSDQGDRGSAFFEAEFLLVWLLSMVYYRKRRQEFS